MESKFSGSSDKTLTQQFCLPWAPFALQRSMKLFKNSLGMEPGITAVPDPEFLVRLITGHSSHQALIRRELGPNEYKNLENLIRGHNKPTAKTWNSLMAAMNVSDEVLRNMVGSQKSGPLLPGFLAVFHMLEGMAVQTYTGLTSVKVSCPHCGHDAMDDTEFFWHRQSVKLDDAAYRFVERLLSAILGAYLVKTFVGNLSTQAPSRLLPSQLCHSNHHPIGNWLAIVQRAHRTESLLSLSMKRSLERKKGVTITHERLLKWSSGVDPMPPEAVTNLIKDIPHASSLQFQLIAARTLALAMDVVSAAAKEGAPSRHTAQRIVFNRMRELEIKCVIASNQARKNSGHLSK